MKYTKQVVLLPHEGNRVQVRSAELTAAEQAQVDATCRLIREATLDDIYEAGKAAFRSDFGTHGPTLHEVPRTRTPNPHPAGTTEADVWERGYQQDVRRHL